MQRWVAHEKALLKNNHHSIKLQEDFNLYGGIEAFDFSILETCSTADLNNREKYYIEKYDSINNGYNGNEQNVQAPKTEVIFTYKSFQELQNRIGSAYLMTYFYLRFHANENNKIILNQTKLADYFGIEVMTISKHIRVLIDNSVIRNVGKSGLYNIYEILV